MESPLVENESVQEASARLFATLGDAKNRLDTASKLAEELVQRLVAQHEEAVQVLKRQLQYAKEELNLAQGRFLSQKEELLAEAASALQILVEEQRLLFQDKESLLKQLADSRASRELEQQRSAEKLLALERQHQKERQYLTEAWEAEKADISKKLKHATKVNHALKRQNQAQLEGGVNQKLQNTEPSQKEAQVSTKQERASTLGFEEARVWLAARERLTPDQGTSSASTVPWPASGRSEQSQMEAAVTPPVRLGAVMDAASQPEQQVPESSSGEKRLRTDAPEGASQAPGRQRTGAGLLDRQLDTHASEEAEGEVGAESSAPSPKRRKQQNGLSAAVPPEVGTAVGAQAITSMETPNVLPEVGERLDEHTKREAVKRCDSIHKGRALPPVEASSSPKEEVLSRKVGPLTAGSTGLGDPDGLDCWDIMVGTVDEALEKQARQKQAQPAPALDQQKPARLHDETQEAGAEDLMVNSKRLISQGPQVLGARDQNGTTDEGKRKDPSNSRRAPGGSPSGRSQSSERQLASSKQAVSERALPSPYSDSDDSLGEVTSPKRQQRARSAGAAGSSKSDVHPTAFKVPRSNGSRQGEAARELRKSFPTVAELFHTQSLQNKELNEDEGCEEPYLSTTKAKESRSKSAERSNVLPRGEKGRWIGAREERAEPKNQSSNHLVQTRISNPPVRKGPSFPKAQASREPDFMHKGEGRPFLKSKAAFSAGAKWREANREDDDFLSTPRERALEARGREVSVGARSGQDGKERPPQTGKSNLARDLGTITTERRSKREEKVTPVDSADDHVSDSEKENSQPEENLEKDGDPSGARPMDREEVNVGRAERRDQLATSVCAVLGEDAAALPVNRGIQVIKPGTYNRTAADRGRQLAGEEVRAYKYNSVVRKKDEREQLHAIECANCKAFYDAVVDHDAAAMGANLHNTCQHHLDNAGRHRYQYLPPATPSGFWNIGFDTETQAAS